MATETVTRAFEALRPQLVVYLTRMVVRVDVAEELAQTTALRALEHADSCPDEPAAQRRWLFRIATNLAFDERKRHGRWRESLMEDLKAFAKTNDAHVTRLKTHAGGPELRTIAREHLAFCLACTLGRLPRDQAAVLLLREMCGFERTQIASILETDETFVKNALQRARRATREAYANTCALMTKKGVCYQCAELDRVYGSGQELDPLAGASERLKARLQIARDEPFGAWTRWLGELLSSME